MKRPDWIDRVQMRLAQWELRRLAPQLAHLEHQVANMPATTAKKMAAHDAEAQLRRDHYKARLQIDNIEAGRELAAVRHRVEQLQQLVAEIGGAV